MAWEIEYTDEFARWWEELSAGEQHSVAAKVLLLEEQGVTLDYPHSSQMTGSRYGNLRELRIQHAGRPYRVLYAFDPRRIGLLLLGGDKTGNNRWYEQFVPKAEALYADHLKTLDQEGLL